MLKHPFIQHRLQRVLMKWVFRLCTSGGFRLPGFALADDGYLFVHGDRVACGSDWIPQSNAIANSDCKCGLVVRYPIRMKEDQLPVENVSAADSVPWLTEHLPSRGCYISSERVADISKQQLQLAGTLVLHSEIASKNVGDFDFDMVCLVEDNRFPLFVRDRFAYQDQHSAIKNKNPKPPSPCCNLPQVAIQALSQRLSSGHNFSQRVLCPWSKPITPPKLQETSVRGLLDLFEE